MIERAAIYVRVSGDNQRHNYSPATQLSACQEYAKAHGYAIVGNRFVDPVTAYDALPGNGAVAAYVDDYTSWELSRPMLDAALEYAKTDGYDVLIVHALDRLARDTYIRQTLEREIASRGVKVRYVLGDFADTPEGEVRKDLEATFAKWENAKRLERITRGKMGKAGRGLFVAGRPPYGYVIDPSGPGGLQICEEQAAVVRRIFELYTRQGASIRSIARLLTAEGIRPWRGGNRWGASSLNRILSNEAYIGHAYYNKNARKGKRLELRDKSEWVAIEISPLIDTATFALARSQMADNRARARKQPRRAYLLVGMIVCSNCGLAYHSQAKRVGNNGLATENLSYRHRKSAGHCLNRTVSARQLEAQVWEAISGLLLDPDRLRKGYNESIEQMRAAQGRRRIQLDVLGRAAAKLSQQTDNLLNAYTDPDIGLTKAQYVSERQRLDNEARSVANQIVAIEAELAALPGAIDQEALEVFTADIREFLDGGSEPAYEDKRKILEKLHVRVVILASGGARVEGWYGDPVMLGGELATTY